MADATVAVAAENIRQLAVAHLIVWGAQAILGEFFRQVRVTCHAKAAIIHGGIPYDVPMRGLQIFRGSIAIVAGYAVQSTVRRFWRLWDDCQPVYFILCNTSSRQCL
jgi:hypothetical protein